MRNNFRAGTGITLFPAVPPGLAISRPLSYYHTAFFVYEEMLSPSPILRLVFGVSVRPRKSIPFSVLRRNSTACDSLWEK